MGRTFRENSAVELRDDIPTGPEAHPLESGGGARQRYGSEGIHVFVRVGPARAAL
ncbi:hypothetical protein ACFHYQ_29275 [Sphaerimonospora cavernae]|uniref:Uncharacterized protein n=1 Tax=Sphaerimonospora cavernae TaxID=1740611 RepID=A0ABV6UE10_9ACTN